MHTVFLSTTIICNQLLLQSFFFCKFMIFKINCHECITSRLFCSIPPPPPRLFSSYIHLTFVNRIHWDDVYNLIKFLYILFLYLFCIHFGDRLFLCLSIFSRIEKNKYRCLKYSTKSIRFIIIIYCLEVNVFFVGFHCWIRCILPN